MAACSSDGWGRFNGQPAAAALLYGRTLHAPTGSGWTGSGVADGWGRACQFVCSTHGLRVPQGAAGVEIQGPMGTERMEGSSRRVIILLGESAWCGAI